MDFSWKMFARVTRNQRRNPVTSWFGGYWKNL